MSFMKIDITATIYSKIDSIHHKVNGLGPVVQSIVSLTTSLRRQLVKYMPTKLSNTLLFFVGNMSESFALQKILTFFQQKIIVYL